MCPADLLGSPTVDSLNFWLSRFVVEARRADGKQYPASTINNILAGLYRHAKAEAPTGVVVPNFIDTRNPEFEFDDLCIVEDCIPSINIFIANL